MRTPTRGLSLLLALLLAGCATGTKVPPARPVTPPPAPTPSPVPTPAPATAPARVPAAPQAQTTPSRALPSGPVVWKLAQPVTSMTQLSTLLTQALDRTVTRWEFTWAGPGGSPPTNAQIDAAGARAAVLARVGGPYVAGTQWSGESGDSGMDFAVTIEYRFPADTVAARVLEANAKADAVVAEVIKPSMGDYEKELALHDWLVRHARYDLANFQANTVPNPEYTPYGVLVLGTGVCQSYASAFQQLADRAGLETRMVSGTGNGADHAWNQVQVDGVWYNLDVTWDDPAGAPPAHTYFNVDDRTLSADHKWDAKTAMPCTSLAANWFVRQGAVAHDLKELSARISTALAHRDTKLMAKVEVFSPARFRADVLAAVKRAATLAGISLSWSLSVDEAQGVIDATFKY